MPIGQINDSLPCGNFGRILSQVMPIRSPIVLLLATFVFGACVERSAAQHKTDAASEILALEAHWSEAYKQRDITILATLLAEDFVITVEDGSTFSKGGYIAHTKDTSYHVDIAELSDLRCRMHGNTAVVTGAYHEKGTSKGKPYEYYDRFTDVWMNNNGKWQVISSHYSVPVKE